MLSLSGSWYTLHIWEPTGRQWLFNCYAADVVDALSKHRSYGIHGGRVLAAYRGYYCDWRKLTAGPPLS